MMLTVLHSKNQATLCVTTADGLPHEPRIKAGAIEALKGKR
jgi:hypothetical protein